MPLPLRVAGVAIVAAWARQSESVPRRARIRRVGPGVGGESRGLRWRAAFEGGRGATCGAGRIEECIAAIEAGA